ncbi:WD40/YVTN/BNR-like repeat-containing protein [Gelidibacter mesophilus]|uniref:WD40/YVTN/BNR-like repeat-containing protein n=1 Tax=Gelidibacter mesophilus TaxID=169050 RepID=UPI000403E37B|nr:hypothetical protein [Gelidibacter mesophilus]
MKNLLILFISLFLISCSNSSEEEMESNIIEITDVSKTKVRIGDTLIIKGKNLDLITNFKFTYPNIGNDDIITVEPLEKKIDLIKVIIPILNYEKITLAAFENDKFIISTPLNLFGTFPLIVKSSTDDLQHYDIQNIKMVNEKTAFLAAHRRLYKTTDGGYNWQIVKDFGFYIKPMYFIDENKGWVGTQTDSHFILYYTDDGGRTFNEILKEGSSYNIIDMEFSTPTNGYLLGVEGKIYHTNDNSSFNLIYNSSTSTAGAYFDFHKLSVVNNSLISLGENVSNGKSIIIEGINNTFSYSVFDTWIWDVQQLNENNAFISKNINMNNGLEENLFFKSSPTAAWKKTSDKWIKYFHFTDNNKGIGINYANKGSLDYSVVYETYDGGENWIYKFNFKDFEYRLDEDFYKNYGIITGFRGKIWKHIFE